MLPCPVLLGGGTFLNGRNRVLHRFRGGDFAAEFRLANHHKAMRAVVVFFVLFLAVLTARADEIVFPPFQNSGAGGRWLYNLTPTTVTGYDGGWYPSTWGVTGQGWKEVSTAFYYQQNGVWGWGYSPTVTPYSGARSIPSGSTAMRIRGKTLNNDLTLEMEVSLDPNAPVNKMRMFYNNDKDYPVKLALVNAQGTVLASMTVQPKSGNTLTYTVPNGVDPATLKWELYVPATFGDGGWVSTPLPNTKVSEGAANSTSVPPTSEPPTQNIPQPTNAPGTGGNTSTTINNYNSVWNSTNASTATSQTTALDKSTFREGVDKLERAIKSNTGTGGSQIDPRPNIDAVRTAVVEGLTGVKSSVDAVKQKLTDAKTDADSEKTQKLLEADQALQAMSGQATQRDAKYAQARALLPVPEGSMESVSAGSPSSAFWTFHIGAYTVNANPAANSLVASCFAFTRQLAVWAVLMGCLVGLLKNNDWLVQGVATAQPTQAAPIHAIAGLAIPATAPGLIKAALITALMFASVPISFAFFQHQLGGLSMLSMLFQNPVVAAKAAGSASFLDESVKLLNLAMPLDLTLVCFVTWVTHKFTCQSVTFGIASGMRWIAG